MQNTQYFASMFKNSGVPQMQYEHFSKLMNIIHLESKIHGIKSAAKKFDNQAEFNKLIFDAEHELKKLTLGSNPEDVLKSILYPDD